MDTPVITAIGHKGLIFVWDRELRLLHVRLSGGSSSIETIQLDGNPDQEEIEALIKGWAVRHKAVVAEQDKLAKVKQDADDRAAAIRPREV